MFARNTSRQFKILEERFRFSSPFFPCHKPNLTHEQVHHASPRAVRVRKITTWCMRIHIFVMPSILNSPTRSNTDGHKATRLSTTDRCGGCSARRGFPDLRVFWRRGSRIDGIMPTILRIGTSHCFICVQTFSKLENKTRFPLAGHPLAPEGGRLIRVPQQHIPEKGKSSEGGTQWDTRCHLREPGNGRRP
jgi:hypothetical protein